MKHKTNPPPEFINPLEVFFVIDDCQYTKIGILDLFSQRPDIKISAYSDIESAVNDIVKWKTHHFFISSSNLASTISENKLLINLIKEKHVNSRFYFGINRHFMSEKLIQISRDFFIFKKRNMVNIITFALKSKAFVTVKDKLTLREVAILRMWMERNMSHYYIIRELGVSSKTLYAHKYNIIRKLGLRSDNELHYIHSIFRDTLISIKNTGTIGVIDY